MLDYVYREEKAAAITIEGEGIQSPMIVAAPSGSSVHGPLCGWERHLERGFLQKQHYLIIA